MTGEGMAVNADVSVGSIKVTGDLIGSNIVAGIDAGDDDTFGPDDDLLIIGGKVLRLFE